MPDQRPDCEKNFRIDLPNNWLRVEVSPKLYSIDSIKEAANSFADRAFVSVNGDPTNAAYADFKFKSALQKEEMTRFAYEFMTKLVEASVREIERRRSRSSKQGL